MLLGAGSAKSLRGSQCQILLFLCLQMRFPQACQCFTRLSHDHTANRQTQQASAKLV